MELDPEDAYNNNVIGFRNYLDKTPMISKKGLSPALLNTLSRPLSK